MFGTRACAAAMLDDVPSDGQDCPDEHNGARYIDAVENQHRCQDNKEGDQRSVSRGHWARLGSISRDNPRTAQAKGWWRGIRC